jgi:uncharacterized protein YcbK (DUF882 family)
VSVSFLPARGALGSLRISSGFRFFALNETIHGATNSAHRLGYAADVVPGTADIRAKSATL